MFKKAAVLALLFAGVTVNAQLKAKMAKNLAQQEDDACFDDLGEIELPSVDLPECPCNFTDLSGGLGSGVNQGFTSSAQALSATVLTTVPDTEYDQICQSECCACEEEAHASYDKALKKRTFTINGSISVLETLSAIEKGQAKENSQGKSEKTSICQTQNQEGGLGAGTGDCVVVSCPTNGGIQSGPAL
jgi:hypothetical protein